METDQTIEVILFGGSGRRLTTAEAETPECAVYAGQTIYDEGITGYKERGSVGFYVGGKLVRLVQGRPLGASI